MATPVVLVELHPRNPADGAVQVVRLAGGGMDYPYTYGGFVDWRAGNVQLPTFVTSIKFEGGDFGTGGETQGAEVQWAATTKIDLTALANLFWIDADAVMRIGPENDQGALPPVALAGKALGATIEGGVIKIAMSDPAADLKKPLLTARYGGTGDLDGPPEWDGKIKPRVWGRVWNRAGDCIDKAHNIYCWADPLHPIQAFDAVRDKGAPAAELTIVNWQGSAAATLATLRAAVVPDGGGVVCPSIACVRWWAQPAGDLTADLRGEIGSGYVETTADIVARIVAAGPGTAFAAGTIAAARAARPAPVGWVAADDSTTVASMIEELLGNSSLLWLLNDAGEIVLREWAWGAPVAAGASQSVKRTSVFRPVATRKLGYQRNEKVMARGDLAAIVLTDGVTYGDGTPIDALKPAQPGADVTGDHTSADTGAVNGVPAATITTKLATLETDTATAISNIAALEAQASDLQAQAVELGDAIAEVGGQVVTLQTTTASQGSLIASNATAISNVAGNLATLTTTVSALGTTVSTQASAISSLETQAASLNTTVTAHTASIAANASAIATTNANLAALTTTVSAGGGNLLTNSDFAAGSLAGWTMWYDSGSGAVVDNVGVNLPDANWHPIAENCLALHQANRVGADTNINWTSDAIACQPGDVVQGYAFVAAHRAQVAVQVVFLDDAGSWTGSGWSGLQTVGTGGRSQSDYTQVGVPAIAAPAGTTRAVLVVLKWDTAAGYTDSWMWVLRPYLGYARAGQATFNTYSRANARAVIQTQATALSTASAQIASLTSTVSSQGASISTQATAISTLNSNVATAFARWALQVDANGYTVGIEINNNGSTGAIKFRSDLFEISSPAGGAKVTFIAGVLRFIDSSGVARVEMGIA